jgi:hypothetical protein
VLRDARVNRLAPAEPSFQGDNEPVVADLATNAIAQFNAMIDSTYHSVRHFDWTPVSRTP